MKQLDAVPAPVLPVPKLELEATYEHGTLKLDQELPLENGQRVRLIIQQSLGQAKADCRHLPLDGRPPGS